MFIDLLAGFSPNVARRAAELVCQRCSFFPTYAEMHQAAVDADRELAPPPVTAIPTTFPGPRTSRRLDENGARRIALDVIDMERNPGKYALAVQLVRLGRTMVVSSGYGHLFDQAEERAA